MIALHILTVVFSFILLAAHFLREANTILVAMCLIAPFFLIVKRPWAARLLQLLLAVGSMVWILTLAELVMHRVANGEPWMRLVFILGGVALFTGFSAWLFSRKHLSVRFGLKPSNNPDAPSEDLASGVM